MAIRAYDEIYLSGAQYILGDAADFAVVSPVLDPDTFGNALAVSSASRQFANGNPKYVAGMNGCELARIILTETNTSFTDTEDAMLSGQISRIPVWLGTGVLPVAFLPFFYPKSRIIVTNYSLSL